VKVDTMKVAFKHIIAAVPLMLSLTTPVVARARSEQRSIGKVAQEFLERTLGADAPVGA
jgi:hypothetical protein